ncbi:uncharacterized protein LOC116610351 [Nematostella vectensis]|uniref:uncharacterized protein LOC116610351 n=1 Tax=Nematostella vectensis TaxID=45351 RepID=UPI0013906ED8|nr:uncharacterized protein LOC116610351 [Nematostella vectensis]
MSPSFLARTTNWFKMAWVEQPIIFVSLVMGFASPAIVYLSPWTKDSIKAMQAIPNSYPYPQLQDADKE